MEFFRFVTSATSLLISLTLLGAGVVAWKNRKYLLEAVYRPWNEATQARLDVLEEFVETLPGVYEGFATEARKNRQRATWHVNRVKKELEKHGLRDVELDELSGNIRPLDGEGGEQGEMLTLHAPMEPMATTTHQAQINDLRRRKFGA